jgi:AcrR family transcriptional regulator
LLEAAERLFAERGWAATRVEDVAREARLSPATAYNYFPTKHALISGAYAAVWFRSADAHAPTSGVAVDLPGGHETSPAVQALTAYLLHISRISRERLHCG